MDPFALKCENNEQVGDNLKEIYFFNKTKRFTGYYSIKSDATLNISGIEVPYKSERNKCRYDGEERNRLFYNCESEYTGFELPQNSVGIDREKLVMIRSYTTAKYKYDGLQIFSCEKLSKSETQSKLDFFKQEKKDLDKTIRDAKKTAKSLNEI